MSECQNDQEKYLENEETCGGEVPTADRGDVMEDENDPRLGEYGVSACGERNDEVPLLEPDVSIDGCERAGMSSLGLLGRPLLSGEMRSVSVYLHNTTSDVKRGQFSEQMLLSDRQTYSGGGRSGPSTSIGWVGREREGDFIIGAGDCCLRIYSYIKASSGLSRQLRIPFDNIAV